MSEATVQRIFELSFGDYLRDTPFISEVQRKASHAILNCRTGALGVNVMRCSHCGHIEVHNNSCRNRNCPQCQAVLRERWVDERRQEVIEAPYFHVVFTIPHELNPLFLSNQKLLYSLLHRCCSETLLELSRDRKYLGALPGIIQVLHTWNQQLDYHVHMHCIISGGGVTSDLKLRRSKDSFFIPVRVLRDKFRGKFLANLEKLYHDGKLTIPASVTYLGNPVQWDSFRDSLYRKDWCPYIKETFNGCGNAIEYLGKYTNKIAISNSRIESVGDDTTTFSARGIHPGDPRRMITLKNTEFIRRFLMHVLPSGFQKIRYYGLLNNRRKSFYLGLIFKLQGSQRFKSRFITASMEELMKQCFNVDIRRCPVCGNSTLETVERTFVSSA